MSAQRLGEHRAHYYIMYCRAVNVRRPFNVCSIELCIQSAATAFEALPHATFPFASLSNRWGGPFLNSWSCSTHSVASEVSSFWFFITILKSYKVYIEQLSCALLGPRERIYDSGVSSKSFLFVFA